MPAEQAETTAASAFEQLPRSPTDKLLFTPGPLTTSMTVKQAMLRDLGSRDPAFRQVIQEVRNGILRVAALSRDEGYEAIPMQGCGTMGLESVLTSVLPPRFKLLVLINGAYGERIYRMAKRIGDVEVVAIRTAENQVFSLDEVDRCLERDCDIASVAVVHCETTSGILNPIESLGTIVKRHGRRYIVDSMSGFGGIEFDFRACGIDYLISSANKCIEGVPGFSFVIARRADLERVGSQARTVSLDLLANCAASRRMGSSCIRRRPMRCWLSAKPWSNSRWKAESPPAALAIAAISGCSSRACRNWASNRLFRSRSRVRSSPLSGTRPRPVSVSSDSTSCWKRRAS